MGTRPAPPRSRFAVSGLVGNDTPEKNAVIEMRRARSASVRV
jgi:hypothetical protein